MYKKIAQSITNRFVSNGSISKEKATIYSYGFEVLISTVVYTIIFIAIATITKTLIESFAFWLGFFIVRTIAGGYHANTYISCHILFSVTHLVFIGCLKIIPMYAQDHLIVMFAGISVLVLLIAAPVDHKNKRFTPVERKRFKTFSIIYALVLSVVTPLFLIFHFIDSALFFSFMIGTLIAALSVVGAKIKNKKDMEDRS